LDVFGQIQQYITHFTQATMLMYSVNKRNY